MDFKPDVGSKTVGFQTRRRVGRVRRVGLANLDPTVFRLYRIFFLWPDPTGSTDFRRVRFQPDPTYRICNGIFDFWHSNLYSGYTTRRQIGRVSWVLLANLTRVFSDEFFSFSDPTRLIWLDEIGYYFNDTTLRLAFGITTRRRVVRVRKVNPTTFRLDKSLPFLTRPERWNSITSGPIQPDQ